MSGSGVRLILWAALGFILTACGTGPWQVGASQSQAPSLSSAYADLTEFWQQAASSLKIEPEEGRLHQLNLGYDANGDVIYLTFTLNIDRGTGKYDVYNFSQQSGKKASWHRETLEGSAPEGSVPADKAFAAVNRISFQDLERHQKLSPPARFWFFAESGSKTYKPIAGGYLVQDGHFTPMGPEGVTMRGDHGAFGIAEGALTTTDNSARTATQERPGPPLFLVSLSPQ